MNSFDDWLRKLDEMKHFDPERALPESLVTRSDSARWLGPELTGNAALVGVLSDVPARSMEFYLQEIPPQSASDLQRHLHESVHCVTAGSGYSEIGGETVRWETGDFIYTPPMVWHRHYNDGQDSVHMILVENSRLLDGLGINRRETAGNITYAEYENGDDDGNSQSGER